MFCPQCGKETSSGGSVCENCGAPLWADTKAPQQPQAPVEPQIPQQPQASAPVEPQVPQQPYNAAPPQPPVYPQQPYNAVPPQPPVAPPQAPVYPQQPQQPVPHISNYLAWAIVCIFLCWPLAIPAIVYASKVNNLIAMGDYEGAMNASKNAKTFCLIATILGAVAVVLGIIFGVIGGLAASSYYYYY